MCTWNVVMHENRVISRQCAFMPTVINKKCACTHIASVSVSSWT